MSTFPLKAKDTLTVSVDGGDWQTLRFKASDFKKSGQASAAEVAKAVNRSKFLAARVDDAGGLVIETLHAGAHTSIDIDWTRSSAAVPLGLRQFGGRVRGRGLSAALLCGKTCEPFNFARNTSLRLRINGEDQDFSIKKGRRSAARVAAELQAQTKAVRFLATPQRCVQIVTISTGPESSLAVVGNNEQTSATAAILGFQPDTQVSHPHVNEPARLACAGPRATPTLVNLTNSAIELHLGVGTQVLPVRGRKAVSPSDAASPQVQALVRARLVGMTFEACMK